MKSAQVFLWLLFLVLAGLTGCGRSRDVASLPPSPESSPAAPSTPSVELSQSQLRAIKVGPAIAHSFPVEREAPGSISFKEDPAVVQAESTLIGAAAASALAHAELARVQGLGTANGIPQKELEQAQSDQETADAALKAARDAVLALGKTDAQIDRMIAAGRIETASAGTGRWVVAYVPEADSPMLHVGEPAHVSLEALPGRVFHGAVSLIYGTVDPNLHRVTVRCALTEPGTDLRPGMLADVAIEVGKPVDSPAVPADSVVREGDGTMTVWVTADRRQFTQRTVVTGLREDGLVQILKGVKAGELVVTAGAIFLDNMLQARADD